jgi:hypothetical protein
MPFTTNSRLGIIERKLDALNKAVWSLRSFFSNPINFSERDLKQHWKDLKVTTTDLQAAKKAISDFDIGEFVTKRDIRIWKKKKQT